MKKILATAVLTGIASVFAVPGSAQVPGNAMALNTSAPMAMSAAAPMTTFAAPLAVKASASMGLGAAGSSRAEGSRFASSLLPEGPSPDTAWVFAAGFLALVVIRRLNSSSF